MPEDAAAEADKQAGGRAESPAVGADGPGTARPDAGGPGVLGAATAGERAELLMAHLVRSVQRALGASTVDPDAPLSGLGLDSLMAVELRNEIRGRLGVSLAIAGLLSGATIRSVSQQIATLVANGVDGGGGSDGGAIRRVARAEDVAAQLLAQVEQAAGTETVGSVAGAPAATSAEQGNV